MSEIERENEELLEFLYACPVGLVEFDRAGLIRMINPHAMKHLLPLAGARDAQNLFSILVECAPEVRNLVDAFTSPTGTICDGHRMAIDLGRGPGGAEPRTLACTIVRLAADRFVATFTDISVQVAQERRLKDADTWFAALTSGVNDYAVVSITADGTIDAANPSFSRQTGYDCASVIGRPLDMVFAAGPAGAPRLADQLQLAKRDGWYLDESRQTRRNGEQYWCQRLITARADGYSVVLRDVVRQESDTAQLRRMLNQDDLTGAFNRAHFGRQLECELRRFHDEGHPLALLLIDIDHFKSVNDRHGHPLGDAVLRRMSARCMAMLRPSDLFARLGGEEFAVLLPATALAEALEIGEQLRAGIAAMTIDTPTGPVRVTASFGCAIASDATVTIDALIGRADELLYVAKRAGRDRICAVAA